MSAHTYGNNKHSAMYLKAMEIFSLARNISTYLSYDLAGIQKNGKEDPESAADPAFCADCGTCQERLRRMGYCHDCRLWTV